MSTAAQFGVPDFPRSVIRFHGVRPLRVPPSAASTVAIPGVASWGPLGSQLTSLQDGVLTSLDEIETLYSPTDSPLRRAAILALVGAGTTREAGAGGVLLYRIGNTVGAGALAAATVTLAGATGPVLTLSAKYPGTFGNALSLVHEGDPANIARSRVRVLLRGATVDRYTYANGDVTALRALIIARPSSYLSRVVPAVVTDQAITNSASALTGGADGATPTATDQLAALDGLEYGPFSLLSFPDLTDNTVQVSARSWVRTQAGEMRPVRMTVGGAAADGVDSAVARSALLADEHIVNIGVGTWHDDLLDRDLSTAELAPRLAGMLAARGRKQSLDAAEMAGLHPVKNSGAKTDELKYATSAGVVVLRRASNPEAEVVCTSGVTTFTDDTIPDKPRDIYGDPRLIGILDQFIRTNTMWGDREMVGDTVVDEDSRAAVRTHVGQEIDDLIRERLVKADPKPYVNVEPTTDPQLKNAIPYTFGWEFAATTKYLIGLGAVQV